MERNFKMASSDNKKNPSFLYRLFYSGKDGKGVEKKDKHPRTFKYFFPFTWRNIGLLFTLNMFLVIGNFPVLIALYGLTGNLNIRMDIPVNPLSGVFNGIAHVSGANPLTMSLKGVGLMADQLSIITTPTKVLFLLGLLTFFTFGIVNVGTAYIMRNVVKGEPVFLWDDFKHAIKNNWKQGMIYGIIDLLICLMLGYDLILYFINLGSVMNGILFGVMLLCTFLYICMRFYMYIMMVTFDLSIPKLIKNAFIFSVIGMKRNAAAFFGIVLTIVLNYLLLTLFMPIGIILPFVITFSLIEFIGIYAAYPKMKEIMIDPYYETEEEEPEPEEPKKAVLLRDRFSTKK